jgi:hypothetical protein
MTGHARRWPQNESAKFTAPPTWVHIRASDCPGADPPTMTLLNMPPKLKHFTNYVTLALYTWSMSTAFFRRFGFPSPVRQVQYTCISGIEMEDEQELGPAVLATPRPPGQP